MIDVDCEHDLIIHIKSVIHEIYSSVIISKYYNITLIHRIFPAALQENIFQHRRHFDDIFDVVHTIDFVIKKVPTSHITPKFFASPQHAAQFSWLDLIQASHKTLMRGAHEDGIHLMNK